MNKSTRKKIKNLIKEGKTSFSPAAQVLKQLRQDFASQDWIKTPDFDYLSCEPFDNSAYKGIEINWGKDGFGFGQVVFAQEKGTALFTLDDEFMGEEFAVTVLGIICTAYPEKMKDRSFISPEIRAKLNAKLHIQ